MTITVYTKNSNNDYFKLLYDLFVLFHTGRYGPQVDSRGESWNLLTRDRILSCFSLIAWILPLFAERSCPVAWLEEASITGSCRRRIEGDQPRIFSGQMRDSGSRLVSLDLGARRTLWEFPGNSDGPGAGDCLKIFTCRSAQAEGPRPPALPV
jgi:hypothetical protein